jgi:hypothetical protein
MRIVKENWKVLASLFPVEWQQMARRSGAVQRLRGACIAEFFPYSMIAVQK